MIDRRYKQALGFSLLAAVSLAIGWPWLHADDTKPKASAAKGPQVVQSKVERDQSEFMRKKLVASNQILEGLVTENASLVVKGAKELVEMSSAEKWQVQHNVMYKQYSNEFLQSAKKLVEAGEKENFDAVTLKWIDTTMKCIECHKFVRANQVAGTVK